MTRRARAGDSPRRAAQDLAAALQAKDPTNRYTTAAPTDAGIVQVLGGGGGPVMLVSISASRVGGREPVVRRGAGRERAATMYYVGHEPPAYTAERPGRPRLERDAPAIVPSTRPLAIRAAA